MMIGGKAWIGAVIQLGVLWAGKFLHQCFGNEGLHMHSYTFRARYSCDAALLKLYIKEETHFQDLRCSCIRDENLEVVNLV
jgi:hypothetical protein